MSVPLTTIELARPVYPTGKWKKPGGGVGSFRIARPAFWTWCLLQEKSVFAFSWFGCHCLGLEAYDVWYVPVKVGIETGRCSCTFAISSVLFSGKL